MDMLPPRQRDQAGLFNDQFRNETLSNAKLSLRVRNDVRKPRSGVRHGNRERRLQLTRKRIALALFAGDSILVSKCEKATVSSGLISISDSTRYPLIDLYLWIGFVKNEALYA
jgi:hypothetical protein